jgi:flagellar basal-body rod protein FlgF
MNIASLVATSRLSAQQRAMDVTAANLANLNTPGHRAERVQFADYLARQTRVEPPPGGRVIAFTQDRATWREFKPGTMTQTGNPLDLAIPGDGFFTVETERGPRLTRAGRFTQNGAGEIVTETGHALLDANGQKLRVPAGTTRLGVSADGTIATQDGPIGRIGVRRPTDAMRMKAEGDHLFRPEGPTVPVEQPGIVQGAVEGSNVQPVLETVRMMRQLREFQFASQFVQAESERIQNAIERILRPRA